MPMPTVREFIDDHRGELLADLDQWLRIPGISAQPEHHGDVQRSAEWFAEAARRTGLQTVEIWPTKGLPAVYAEWRSDDPQAPTVLVYGHHDVQPVDPIESWRTDPFDPTIDGDLLRARGASDDKGQLLFHLLGLRAHLAATGRTTPAVNLKFLIEGEEESGSPNFEDLLAERRDRLDCDVVVITDTGMLGLDIPSTVTGMRGTDRVHRRLPRSRPRPALGILRRCRAQPGHGDRPAGRRPARRARPRPDSRLLRRRPRTHRRRA